VRLDVYFTPSELAGAELPGRVVVVDVLRATSTIVEALTNGAKAVFPVDSADEAARIAQGIGRDTLLLCGERKGLRIEGFDLGNAPTEFSPDRVRGNSLAMTTSNGTRAFLAVAERRGGKANGGILAGSFLNLTAVARVLADEEQGTIVCAGRDGRFGLDDALCAGALIQAVERAGASPELNDAAEAARRLPGTDRDMARALARTAAGEYLASIGHGADVRFCGQVDRSSVVPRFRDRTITAD
jgi:2-phosphosulfolactate phosphatase